MSRHVIALLEDAKATKPKLPALSRFVRQGKLAVEEFDKFVASSTDEEFHSQASMVFASVGSISVDVSAIRAYFQRSLGQRLKAEMKEGKTLDDLFLKYHKRYSRHDIDMALKMANVGQEDFDIRVNDAVARGRRVTTASVIRRAPIVSDVVKQNYSTIDALTLHNMTKKNVSILKVLEKHFKVASEMLINADEELAFLQHTKSMASIRAQACKYEDALAKLTNKREDIRRKENPARSKKI